MRRSINIFFLSLLIMVLALVIVTSLGCGNNGETAAKPKMLEFMMDG